MTTDRNTGRVRVSIETSASVELAFDALVVSDQLACWLGTPTEPLRAGGATRIEFGDGDFFTVDRVEIARPGRVAYTWRFLGLGAQNDIAWTVARRGARTAITVSDVQPERDGREVEALHEGWRDFLDRLSGYLETGARARYDWRRDIDGAVELACSTDRASARLFTDSAFDRWMPWRGAQRTGTRLQVADDGAPATLQLVELARDATELRFAVTAPGWKHATRCELALTPRRAGSMLTVSHTGWPEIDDSDAVQRSQRERFCRLWIDSLTRARALGGEP